MTMTTSEGEPLRAGETGEAAIRRLIARIGGQGYRDGSSTTPGWTYHPIPFPELEDVPAHKQTPIEEHATILKDLGGSVAGLRILDIGCALGYFSFRFAPTAREVVAVEGDEDVHRVVEAVCRWKGIRNIHPIRAYMDRKVLASIEGSFDVALMLNVHMWIHKQLGPEETMALMRDLAGRTRRLYFQTAHAESGGMYRVDELRNRKDVQAYLERCGFSRVRRIRDTRAHRGKRTLFACES